MKHEQSELKIRVTQLSEGVHHYQFTSQPNQLDLPENFQDLVEITAELDKTQRQMYLKTLVSTKIGFCCDRCADDFLQDVQSSYGICYAYDENGSSEYPDDEIRIIHPGTPYIDITEDVRQVLILAVPMKVVCQDDCKGLCPHCGKNLNKGSCDCKEEYTDSRWDELQKLIQENN